MKVMPSKLLLTTRQPPISRPACAVGLLTCTSEPAGKPVTVNCCSTAVLAATAAGVSAGESLNEPKPRNATTPYASLPVGVMLPPAGMLSNVTPSVLPDETRTLPTPRPACDVGLFT